MHDEGVRLNTLEREVRGLKTAAAQIVEGLARAVQALAQSEPSGGGSAPATSDSFLAETVANGQSYPTTGATYYYVQPLVLSGTPAVGASASFTPQGNPVLAANVGGTAPPANTEVRVSTNAEDGQLFFLYNGQGS